MKNEIITPQSLLIEKTALELATAHYEAGRSMGLKSKHKNAKSYARAYVEKFIPLAVNFLLEMLSKPHVSQEQKDLIYDALMERTNDPSLSDCGVSVFKNKTPYKSDKHIPDAPMVVNSLDRFNWQKIAKREVN